jgi:hypothetical protein
MNSIDLSKYKIKEIVHEEDHIFDEHLKYLLNILNDRTIPENNKKDIRKQFDEIVRLQNIIRKPPNIVQSTVE